MTAGVAQTVLEPVGIDSELGTEDLFHNAKCKMDVDVPVKVQTSLLSAMPGVVIPPAAATIVNAKAPGCVPPQAPAWPAAGTWPGGLGEDGGHLVFTASEDFRRSLESLLKL